MNEHIDVRGLHPIYVNGCWGIVLEGARRNISVEDARLFIIRHGLIEQVPILSWFTEE